MKRLDRWRLTIALALGGDILGRDHALAVRPGGETGGEAPVSCAKKAVSERNRAAERECAPEKNSRSKAAVDGALGVNGRSIDRGDGEFAAERELGRGNVESREARDGRRRAGRAALEEGRHDGDDGASRERGVHRLREGSVAVEEAEEGVVASLDGQDRAGGGKVGLVADVAYGVRKMSEATLGPNRVRQKDSPAAPR